MTAKSSEVSRPRGRVIKVSPAKVRVARLIVKRADEGKGTVTDAVRAMAKAQRPRGELRVG